MPKKGDKHEKRYSIGGDLLQANPSDVHPMTRVVSEDSRANWSVDAKAKSPINILGTIRLPSEEGTDVVRVHVTRDEQALVPSIEKNPTLPSPYPTAIYGVILTPVRITTVVPLLTPFGPVTPSSATTMPKRIPTKIPIPTPQTSSIISQADVAKGVLMMV